MPKDIKRTDDDKMTGAPVMVTLGGKEYPVYPKKYKEKREWRQKAKAVFDTLDVLNRIDFEKDQVQGALFAKNLMLDFIDECVDLLFEWEPTLPKEEILENATEEELIDAIWAVKGLVVPLVLQKIMGSQGPQITK